jgi:hypothetical protein
MGIELRAKQNEGRDSAGQVAEKTQFGLRQGAAQLLAVAVGELLFEHRVAANGVLPGRYGDVLPEGMSIFAEIKQSGG